MGSKVIRNVTKILKATSGRLFGRVTAGTGRAEELTPADVRTLLEVATTTQIAAAYQPIGSYQETLVSGTNIKTVNSTSLLGSGDIVVSASPAGSSGQVQFNDAGSFGGATAVVYAGSGTHVMVTAQSSTAIPLCVKGAASQSGNLQEWQNSSGTILARISSAGSVVGASASFADGAWQFLSSGVLYSFTNRTISINDGSFNISSSGTSDGVLAAFADLICQHGSGKAVYIGNGRTSATPISTLMYGTGGSGTNIAGSAVSVGAGRSTGNATPAAYTIQTTTVGSSGSTLQTLRNAIQVDGNTTSGETPLLLLDLASETLKRVSIGASDSGGAGFKVLRVPN
jgi:hypothetical protein